MSTAENTAKETSPLRGEVGERSEPGGGEKPFSKLTQSNARRLRKQMTDAEKKLWAILRRKQFVGYKFRRQQPIGNYIADFACMDLKLIIEADGGQHIELRSEHDRIRDAFLEKEGYRVLRFWNNDILRNTGGVSEAILRQIHHPHPNPPPSRGRGRSSRKESIV